MQSTVVGNGKIHDNNKAKQKRNEDQKDMRQNKKSRGTGSNISLTNGLHVDSAIVSDILSRLPVKSIVRFKCVCKHWRFLIEEDSYFIDLHLNRSKISLILFFIGSMVAKYTRIFIPEINKGRLVTVMLEGRGIEASTLSARTIRKMEFPLKNASFFGPVNGLIGYESDDSKNSAIRICNISTQEVSPWIKSELSRNYDAKEISIERPPSYEMGYDPATKKQKVICIWRIQHLDDCEVSQFVYDSVSEVLTVGDIK